MNDFLVILIDLMIGLAIASLVSFYAYKKRSLAFFGMIASIVMGTIIYMTGGVLFTVVMLFFFISSSVLSKILHQEHKRDSVRTYKQVLANGGIATILSILYAVEQDDLFKLLFVISIAVSTADTWSSEIGRLSASKPRHILTWKQVETGRSGGITLLGTGASFVGSLMISIFYGLQIQIIFFGWLGSVIDSILGTMQLGYVTKSGLILDEPSLKDETIKTKGIPYLTNNLVNLFSNGITVLLAYLYLIFI